MLPHQFQDLLNRYERGACSPDEEKLVEEWYRNIGTGDQIVLQEEEKGVISEKIWAAINPGKSRKSTFFPWLNRAAFISVPLLACVAFYLNRQSLSTIVTAPQGVQQEQTQNLIINHTELPREIRLADGSEVLLQPDSEINVDADFGDETREVRLKGEAFFNVSRDPDRPFVVYANEVVTRVLGTSFNIRAYAEDREITVAVKSGKVSVYTGKTNVSGTIPLNANKEVILTPNQKMVYHRLIRKVSKKLVEEPEVIVPDSDLFRMHFENAEVSKIFAVLEKNYGVEILYDGAVLRNCKLTTSMSDEGLFERIAVICKAIGASYAIDDDAVITIQSDGC